MGNGYWSSDVYTAACHYRRRHGTSAFAYSDSGARGVHEALDPFGVTVRESRDSQEHPTSVPITVLFDVTGSMGHVPRRLQQKLPRLHGLLDRGHYVTDPQIMFGAIGDATCDRAPLQVGQFESDNRMDDDLGRILLEGGGGGQMTESYELALYFMARHTAHDAYDRRGRRGYLFVIGDEMPYPRVKAHEVRSVVGDRAVQDIPVARMLDEVRERYDTWFMLPTAASYGGNRKVLGAWRRLLGQQAVELDDLDAVCETIALIIGLGEEATDLDAGLADLADAGTARTVSRALSDLPHPRAGADG